jgi:citrate synthase
LATAPMHNVVLRAASWYPGTPYVRKIGLHTTRETMTQKATLEFNGKKYELDVLKGTEDETAIDISDLRAKSGAITLDEGYANSGSCKSTITFIDGDKGILQYRGYPIEELAEKATFLETSYALIYGELPNAKQIKDFRDNLTRHTLLHEDMRPFFEAFPPDAHPMAILSSVVSGLSTFYQDSHKITDTACVDLTIRRLLAKLPTITAFAYRKSRGLPLMYPDNSLGYSANFLRMMFGYPTEMYVVDEELARTMDVLFILHADHEQNCSTSTVRLAGSSHANLFASITAGICALWGPRHGGANQMVLEMLAEIQAEGGNVKKFIERAKDKNSKAKLMGFGHRVYKNFDPRAKIIKGHCDRVLSKMGIDDPLLDIAKELEEAALKDSYFIERKLYPNVDFYSGIIYKALGFPTNMFTALFAMGRLPGWIAQWKEMIEQDTRIGRPRQLYMGKTKRPFVPVEKRG